MIKAIPWKYNGLQFRSKLEARWYAAFQLLDFKIEYEPKAFQVFDCHDCFLGNWLPDFSIDGRLVEIKPLIEIGSMSVRDMESVRNAVVCGYSTPTVVILGQPKKFVAFEVVARRKGNPDGYFLNSRLFHWLDLDYGFKSWYPDEGDDLLDFSLSGLRRINADFITGMENWQLIENMIQWTPN